MYMELCFNIQAGRHPQGIVIAKYASLPLTSLVVLRPTTQHGPHCQRPPPMPKVAQGEHTRDASHYPLGPGLLGPDLVQK